MKFHELTEIFNFLGKTFNFPVKPINFPGEPFNFLVKPFNFPAEPFNFPAEPYNFPGEHFNFLAEPFNFPAKIFNFQKILSRIIQELDISATDLSSECLIDMLTRIPALKFLSAGQINGFNDSVMKAWMDSGACRSLTAIDLDSSDNLSDEILNKFITRYGSQLQSCVLSGMSHITDQLWMSILPLLSSAKILVMGTNERLSVNIHVDQLMDAIATNCPKLERLELR